MEWMRCNFCWIKVERKQSQFHLTQCGHVYCDKCIVKAEERCFQCGSEGAISLSLKEPLNPQIAHYFTQTADLLDKVIQAKQFQDSQISLYLKRADANDNKYQTLKEAYWISAENLKKVYQKYNKLKMSISLMQKENKKLTDAISAYTPMQYQTPPNDRSNLKYQENCVHEIFAKQINQNSQRNDEVFRVPSSRRVPRSAGYFSSSTTSSNTTNYILNTPKTNFSNFH